MCLLHCVDSVHGVEPFGQSNILAQHLFKTMFRVAFQKKSCQVFVHIVKYLVICMKKIVGLEKCVQIDQHPETKPTYKRECLR